MFIGNNISSSSGRTLSSGPRALASFPAQPELTCCPTSARGQRAGRKADGGAEKYIPSCREHLTFTKRMVAQNTNAARAVDMQRINILKGQERKQSPSLISQLNVVPSYWAQTLKSVCDSGNSRENRSKHWPRRDKIHDGAGLHAVHPSVLGAPPSGQIKGPVFRRRASKADKKKEWTRKEITNFVDEALKFSWPRGLVCQSSAAV